MSFLLFIRACFLVINRPVLSDIKVYVSALIRCKSELSRNKLIYRNVPKFSDRQVWANSADPDQTAPRGAD